jgi:hypothetical protein
VSHRGLATYIKKCLKGKEELWELKYFTNAELFSSKNPLKETQILQDINFYNSIITNLKFQLKPKYQISKILIQK